jgi:outer membrane protein TolC
VHPPPVQLFRSSLLRKLLILAAALAGTAPWALAQSLASDPAAAVPGVSYSSAFGPPGTPNSAEPKPGLAKPFLPQQALQLALLKQPALFITPQMAAQEKADIRTAIHQLAHRLDRAWLEAVAAQQTLGTLREVHEAAQTAADLGQRMVKAGHWSQVPLLQAQMLAAASATQVAQAQVQAFSAREKLIQLTGLWGAQTGIELPQQLPQLPVAPQPLASAEAQALQNQRALARAAFNARQAQAGVSPQDVQALQTTLLQATNLAKPSSEDVLLGAPLNAPALPAHLGRPNSALMEALTEQAHADTLAANTRSQAREAWFRYRTAWDVARHQRDVVLPLSTALQEETQLRYNSMLQSTWDLLASARARLDSVRAATLAQRDFWLAHTDLQAVLAGVEVSFSSAADASSNGASTAQGH